MLQITTDSTCDLGRYANERNIAVRPLSVVLGTTAFQDGVDVTPQDIFAYVQKTGELPKTSAISSLEYEDFFRQFVEEGKTVVHFSVSSKSSVSYRNATEAAKVFKGKVFVVDSMNLSSGQGLLCLKAADWRDEGKNVEEIIELAQAISNRVNTSFIPDRLEYLYKGGRCSRVMMYGANILKIHPLIEMEEGQLFAKTKYRGSMEKCLNTYLNDLAAKYPNYDKTRCFITHSCADEELVALAKKLVAEKFSFDEVLETVAGSVITGHCGKNTIGILFIAQ